MGYLDGITDGSFRKDAEGRDVFYPYGVMGKGRVIPDAETAARIRSSMKGLYLIVFACVIPVAGLYSAFGLSVVYLIALTAALMIAVHFYIRSLVHGLPYSTERLNVREAQRNAAGGHSMVLLVLMAIASAVFVLIGAMMLVIAEGSDRWMGLAGSAFFGFCLFTFIRMIRLKRQG